MNLKFIVENLIESFLSAGKLALQLREKGLVKKIKSDNTPVSNGDLEVNDLITRKISEITPVQPRSYYGIAKYTSECLLRKQCADVNTQLILLRPPLIYGKGDLSRGYGPTGFTYKAISSDEIKWFASFIFVRFCFSLGTIDFK